MEQQYLEIKGTSIRLLIEKAGAGPWLILWPGLGAAAEEFLAFLNSAVFEGVNVVAIDPPGHGYSSEWSDELTMESVKCIWQGVLDHQDIQKAFIGGHSYGAYTAVLAASVLDERIEGFVLLDGGYIDPLQNVDFNEVNKENKAYLESRTFNSWEVFLEEERALALSWDATIEAMLRATMKSIGGKIVPRISLNSANQVSLLLSQYQRTAIEKVNHPTLLLYATLPEEFNEERLKGVKMMRQFGKNLTTTPVPQSGHDLLVDNPTFVTNQVWNFIKKVQSS